MFVHIGVSFANSFMGIGDFSSDIVNRVSVEGESGSACVYINE